MNRCTIERKYFQHFYFRWISTATTGPVSREIQGGTNGTFWNRIQAAVHHDKYANQTFC